MPPSLHIGNYKHDLLCWDDTDILVSLGAFEVTKIAYQLCHVCPFACIRSAPTGLICAKFSIGDILISNFECCEFMGVKVFHIRGRVSVMI